MARQPSPKLQVTKNYRMFHRSDDNRPMELKDHRRLHKSMQKYGFLPSFPLSVVQNGVGKIVKDGQHRLAIAEELGLPVFYVVEPNDFDIAEVNNTQKIWTLRDYAEKWAANGVESYRTLLGFSEKYPLPLGIAVSLLAGTVSLSNVKDSYVAGKFTISDSDWAHDVASLYTRLVELEREIKNARCLEACMWACRAPGFDSSRLIQGAKKCRDKLVSYSTRDAYLAMLDDLYNFGRKQKVPLKFLSEEAMRARNPNKM